MLLPSEPSPTPTALRRGRGGKAQGGRRWSSVCPRPGLSGQLQRAGPRATGSTDWGWGWSCPQLDPGQVPLSQFLICVLRAPPPPASRHTLKPGQVRGRGPCLGLSVPQQVCGNGGLWAWPSRRGTGKCVITPQTGAEVWKCHFRGQPCRRASCMQSRPRSPSQPLPLLSASIGPFLVTTSGPSPLPVSPARAQQCAGDRGQRAAGQGDGVRGRQGWARRGPSVSSCPGAAGPELAGFPRALTGPDTERPNSQSTAGPTQPPAHPCLCPEGRRLRLGTPCVILLMPSPLRLNFHFSF